MLYWYEIFKVFIPRICWLYSMWEISSSLLYYLSISIFIYPSIYFKILFFASDVAVVQGKGNFQKPNLCFGGLGNFPLKIFSLTNYLYINKSLQEICCSFFEVLSINESVHDSTQPNRKTVITTELFSFLSVEKNHSPFSLNFVYGPQSSHRNQW